MTSDLVAQVRDVAGRISDVDDHTTLHLAADRIEALERENAALRLASLPMVSVPIMGCPVCGIGKDGKPMAYTCTRSDCPTLAVATALEGE